MNDNGKQFTDEKKNIKNRKRFGTIAICHTIAHKQAIFSAAKKFRRTLQIRIHKSSQRNNKISAKPKKHLKGVQ